MTPQSEVFWVGSFSSFLFFFTLTQIRDALPGVQLCTWAFVTV